MKLITREELEAQRLIANSASPVYIRPNGEKSVGGTKFKYRPNTKEIERRAKAGRGLAKWREREGIPTPLKCEEEIDGIVRQALKHVAKKRRDREGTR